MVAPSTGHFLQQTRHWGWGAVSLVHCKNWPVDGCVSVCLVLTIDVYANHYKSKLWHCMQGQCIDLPLPLDSVPLSRQRPARQLWPMSSLFILDVYAFGPKLYWKLKVVVVIVLSRSSEYFHVFSLKKNPETFPSTYLFQCDQMATLFFQYLAI